MPDFDLDELLIDAVDEYRADTMGRIRPAGAQVARATAVRRRRVRASMIGVLAVLVVTPLAAYASTHHHGAPQVNASPSIAASPRPSTTPSASPNPSPKPSSTPSSAPPTANTLISQSQLANATLQFPSKPSWNPHRTWGFCPYGKVTLAHGHFSGKAASAHPNAAGDGLLTMVQLGNAAHDVAAIFGCERSDPGMQIVLGFRRDVSGTIHTLGEVDPGVVTFDGITSSGGGAVRVQVSNLAGSDGGSYAGQVLQWRTFRWNGTRYAQSAGSTAFTTSRHLDAHASDLTFGTAKNGILTGTMTVALHNMTGSTMDDVAIVFDSGDSFEAANPTCGALSYAKLLPGAGICRELPVASGATKIMTLRFTVTSSDASYLRSHPDLSTTDLLIQVRIGDQAVVKQPLLGKAIFS